MEKRKFLTNWFLVMLPLPSLPRASNNFVAWSAVMFSLSAAAMVSSFVTEPLPSKSTMLKTVSSVSEGFSALASTSRRRSTSPLDQADHAREGARRRACGRRRRIRCRRRRFPARAPSKRSRPPRRSKPFTDVAASAWPLRSPALASVANALFESFALALRKPVRCPLLEEALNTLNCLNPA